MTGLSPQIAVLGIALGLFFSLVCYLLTNLSPGGMITPGWTALLLIENPKHILLIASTCLLTVLVIRGMQKVVILYGKRLFATVVMVAVFLQMTSFLLLTTRLPGIFENTTLGFIVPGLVAYQLIRQPAVATIASLSTVTALTYGIMLTGVVFGLIPQVGGAAAVASIGGGTQLSMLRFGIALAVVIGGTVALVVSLRHARTANDGGLEII